MLLYIQTIQKRSFVAWFAQNTQMIKSSNFCQKGWTYPLEIFRFFGLLLKIHFSDLKRVLSIQTIQKRPFLAWFAPPQKLIKSSNFWQNAGTNPLGKLPLFVLLLKLHFSGLKILLFYPKNPKTIFSGLICPKDTVDI